MTCKLGAHHFKNAQEVIYSDGIPWKLCAQCKKVKMLNEFNQQGKASSGHRSYCRACDHERDRKPTGKIVGRTRGDIFDREVNSIPKPDAFFSAQHVISNNAGEFKLCARCKKVKLLKFFNEDPIETSKHRSWCIECDNAVYGSKETVVVKKEVTEEADIKTSDPICLKAIERSLTEIVSKINVLLKEVNSNLKFKVGE